MEIALCHLMLLFNKNKIKLGLLTNGNLQQFF
jgi:hypothetical protein